MNFNDIVIKNILRDKWTYISYFISSVFSVLVFFLFSITAFHPMMDIIDTSSTLGLMMTFSSLIVYVFSFVFVVFSMLAFLKKKTKTLGIFMISGASKKQIQQIVFRENMLIAITAIVTSIGFGLIISPLFLMGVKNVLKADSFGMYIPIKAIIVTIVLFSILFLILSRFTTRFIKKEEATQLLKTDVTPEKPISKAPYKLFLSLVVTISLFLSFKFSLSIVGNLGLVFYILLFISLLITMYLILSQGILLVTKMLKKRSSYYKKTNMLFVSNLKAKGGSYVKIIYLLAILLVAVFTATSVLYSSYYNVEESTEAVYPYSIQYVSLPQNSQEQEEKDIQFIEETLRQEKDYISYGSAFKTNWEGRSRVGFISNTNFNDLGSHKELDLEDNEYFTVAGTEGEIPKTELLNDYLDEDLKYKGMQKEMILTSTLQNVYYVVPDKIYESLTLDELKIFAYELQNWPEKIDVAEKIESQIDTMPDQRLVTSKISLFKVEELIKSISFFIGFMLSLIFLSAAMSILYFYLQTSFEGEREKYNGIRKIGLSIKEIRTIVSKELSILVFLPFVFANILLFSALISLRNTISPTFIQMTSIGVGVFALLFILGFFIIRRVYIKKLVN